MLAVTMLRCLCAVLATLVLAGCAAPGPTLGPPPSPILSTRAPQPVAPLPPPIEVPPPPSPPPTVRTLSGATIVVDAGHGGRDSGALGVARTPEKTINLNIAREIARQLEARGANVVMTRGGDQFIELDGRAAMAERTRADLFVSIHSDSSRRSAVTGSTIYISRGAAAASRRAANSIAAALQRAGIECRGVHSAGFRVLVGHSRPAVLVECGFLSNRAEAQRLASSAYQDRVATAITEGIVDHFTR